MADALPIAFVTFKRVVLTAFQGEKLAARVERSGPDWCLYLSDGKTEIAMPPVKALMTSEAAARMFALTAYGAALTELEADRLDASDRAHLLFETGDHDAPDVIKDRNGEVVLALCKRCGRAESELSGPCTWSAAERERLGRTVN